MKCKTDINQLHINCTNCTMTARQLNAFTHFTNVFNGVRDYFVVGGTFVFFATHSPTLKNPKEPPSNRTRTSVNIDRRATTERTPACNSTDKKLAVQCSADIPIAIGMVNQTLVLRINSDSYRNGKNRQLLVAANRQTV